MALTSVLCPLGKYLSLDLSLRIEVCPSSANITLRPLFSGDAGLLIAAVGDSCLRDNFCISLFISANWHDASAVMGPILVISMGLKRRR